MDPTSNMVAIVIMVFIFLAAISLWIVIDKQHKEKIRKLEQEERLLALEKGLPLPDATVSKNLALGAIGVTIPIACLSAALITSALLLPIEESMNRFVGFIVVWGVCGLICITTLPIVLGMLRDKPLDTDSLESEEPPVA